MMGLKLTTMLQRFKYFMRIEQFYKFIENFKRNTVVMSYFQKF